MKGFALGLALKQRRNATRKSPIGKHPTLLAPKTWSTFLQSSVLKAVHIDIADYSKPPTRGNILICQKIANKYSWPTQKNGDTHVSRCAPKTNGFREGLEMVRRRDDTADRVRAQCVAILRANPHQAKIDRPAGPDKHQRFRQRHAVLGQSWNIDHDTSFRNAYNFVFFALNTDTVILLAPAPSFSVKMSGSN